MKRSVIALTVLGAIASASHAQSNVTVYGVVDAGIRNLTHTNAAGESKLSMSSTGTYRTNRFGFKGTEDLGDGLNAHFQLEGGFTTSTGALAGDLFGRTSSVGLGGQWGSLDLGRQYSVTFMTNANFEPFFNSLWTGFALAGVQGGAVRLNNDVQYSGTFGPLSIRAEYALGEIAGNTSAGSTWATGLNYVVGPFNFGGAYMNRKNIAGTAKQNNWSAGGAYTSGPLRVAVGFGYDDRKAGFSSDQAAKIKDAWIGGTYDVTPATTLGAAFYHNGTDLSGITGHKNLALLNSTYSLSKRTKLYAAVDYGKFGGTYNNPLLAQPPGQSSQTGVSVGVNHVF
jgi:predicted porin